MSDSLGWSYPVSRATCSAAGCAEPVSSRGLCARHRIALTLRERRADEWDLVRAPAPAVDAEPMPVPPVERAPLVLDAEPIVDHGVAALFTYPSTGTIHLVDGDWTVCGIYVNGFRRWHPEWDALYEPAGVVEAITCGTCRRAQERNHP